MRACGAVGVEVEILPRLWEDSMNERTGSGGCCVVNLSSPCWETAQEALTLDFTQRGINVQ